MEKSFITGARVEDADVSKKKVQFLYKDGESLNFMDTVSFEQFSLPLSVGGDQAKRKSAVNSHQEAGDAQHRGVNRDDLHGDCSDGEKV